VPSTAFHAQGEGGNYRHSLPLCTSCNEGHGGRAGEGGRPSNPAPSDTRKTRPKNREVQIHAILRYNTPAAGRGSLAAQLLQALQRRYIRRCDLRRRFSFSSA
jgi:hypothetical protein